MTKESLVSKVLLLLCMVLLVGCGTTTSGGGGSEAGNANIAGTVFLTSGEKGTGCLVSAIPVEYIPGSSLVSEIRRAVTDAEGHFTLELSVYDKFNLYIRDTSSKEQMLLREISITEELELADTRLQRPGELKISHPYVSDSSCSYFIKGTEYAQRFSSDEKSDDTLFISLLPSVELPEITIQLGSTVVELSKAIVHPDKSTSITLDTTDTELELWNFSVIAGVSKETMAATGNLDSLRVLIEEQVDDITQALNRDPGLEGYLHYSVDSVYVLSGTVANEILKPCDSFDYRIIYDGHSGGSYKSWHWDSRTMVNHQDETDILGNRLFSIQTTMALITPFALSRGCIETAAMEVPTEKNGVAKTPYIPDLTSMFKPDVYTNWCPYNLAIINSHKDQVVDGPHWWSVPLQSEVSVRVTNFSKTIPLEGALIELFFVDTTEVKVLESVAFSGYTDATGLMIFPHNPFRPIDLKLPAAYYTNAFIRVTYSGDTSYAWLPIHELGAAYMEDATKAFVLGVTL